MNEEMLPKNTFSKWASKRAKLFSNVPSVAASSQRGLITVAYVKDVLEKWTTTAHGSITVLARETKSISYSSQ